MDEGGGFAHHAVQILAMLQPPTHEFLHRTVQSRQMHEQFLKSLARYSNRIERCGSADCRIAWLVGNKRGFAKNVA